MTVLDAAGPNSRQIAYWNESAGPGWVSMQEALDRELEGWGLAAMAALAPLAGERLVDIGCGCGASTLELGRRAGTEGDVLGLDVSAPMLRVARERARNAGLHQVRFEQADAQTYAFERADGAFSRFGVMFFADPVAAFANTRQALNPGGRVAFVCWRPLAENPWMTVPMAAVLPLLPAPPATPPLGAPGPFAFDDRDRLLAILRGAGFADVSIERRDARVDWGDLETSVRLALRLGPVALSVRENPELTERIEGALRTALASYVGEGGVRLDSSGWIVRAEG